MLLNGEPLNRTWVRHAEIADGGELRFEMGNAPLNETNLRSIRRTEK